MANRRVPYLYTKRGVFYLQKRVPADLQHQYGRPFIRKSLRTKDPKQANRLANSLVDGLDREWLDLRFGISEETPASDLLFLQREQVILLSDACADYCRMKGRTDDKKFRQLAERVTDHVISLSGDKALSAYTIHDAKAFRDALKARGAAPTTIKRNFAVIRSMTNSEKRNFSTIRSIINLCIQEHGLDCRNAFSRVYLPDLEDNKKRKPIPLENIRRIQRDCRVEDDEARWLVALIADTGMRLSEAAGLHIDDIVLEDDTPYINLTQHPWRSLKTKGSQRQIPLVGSALWAARRIREANSVSQYAFPRYNKTTTTNANSASAAINKWLRPRVPEGCVIHSFRHSLRDRLRAVECPSDMIDQIGRLGHSWRRSGVWRWLRHRQEVGVVVGYQLREPDCLKIDINPDISNWASALPFAKNTPVFWF